VKYTVARADVKHFLLRRSTGMAPMRGGPLGRAPRPGQWRRQTLPTCAADFR
jgi:hypothetical protein